MKNKKMIEIISGSFKRIDKFFYKIIEHFEFEDIHEFRVEVKKLRAFTRLVAFELPEPQKLKIPKRLKSMYGCFGIIRNLQLQQQRISKITAEQNLNKAETYLQLLADEEKESKTKAKDLANHHSFDHEKEKIIKALPDKLGKDSINMFIQQKVKELKELLALHHLNDEELHEIRKILKDIFYNWTYIEQYAASVLHPDFANPEKIKLLTGLLGDFHDICIALNLLQPDYTGRVKDVAEKTMLLDIERQLQEEKTKSSAQICEQLKLMYN
ncbi:MAG: CHAD domain-containing protein [Bacteroidota bacterium]|nr:CHAD domain-containing protein [Bacteroidota bacterium]